MSRVAIVGCGISGISAALALAREGITSDVYERSAEIGEVGAGLQVAPNAGRILGDLGVLDHLTVKEVIPDRAVMRDIRTGEQIIAIDFGQFPERFGSPYRVMHRGDLLASLIKAAASTGLVSVHPGKELVGVDQTEDDVTLTFADGEQATAEVLLGADGIRSRVRQIFKDASLPLASRYVIYRGTFARTGEFENAVTLQTGANHHVMHYPIRGGEMMNLVCSFKSERGPVGSEAWGTSEELEEYFADANPVVRSAISQLERERKWVQFDRTPEPGWVFGRVLLIGDAAHPTHQYLAQGACQALEDAVALARLFSFAPDDLVGQLPAFEAERYERTAAVTLGSRFWGELTHVGGAGAITRDTLLRSIGADGLSHLDWLYSKKQGVPPVIPPWQDDYAVLEAEKAMVN